MAWPQMAEGLQVYFIEIAFDAQVQKLFIQHSNANRQKN